MPRTLLLIEREAPADLAIYRPALAAAAPDFDIVMATSEDEAVTAGRDAEILIGKAQSITSRLFHALPNLRWIQALTSGTDPIDALNLPSDIIVTSMRGIHAPQMAELAILLMLALQRQFPRMLRNQEQRRWERWPQPLLAGRTALLVGVGQISEGLAARCAAFGMRVEGISDGRAAAPGFAVLYPRARLCEAIAQADFVIALVPYSGATRHLIDEAALRAMRPDAFLINIARGGVVDEAALRMALEQGWIAGAGLDVFGREPLPEGDPIWSAPNVIITPHIGGMSDRYAEQAAPVMSRNLAAYAAGKLDQMVNVVRRPD
jgi:phosphoglycerate dehydrogenase-like enzyme